jgi:hypothetical protein
MHREAASRATVAAEETEGDAGRPHWCRRPRFPTPIPPPVPRRCLSTASPVRDGHEDTLVGPGYRPHPLVTAPPPDRFTTRAPVRRPPGSTAVVRRAYSAEFGAWSRQRVCAGYCAWWRAVSARAVDPRNGLPLRTHHHCQRLTWVGVSSNARSGAVGHGAGRPTHRGSSAPASWSPGPAEWNRRPVRIVRQ